MLGALPLSGCAVRSLPGPHKGRAQAGPVTPPADLSSAASLAGYARRRGAAAPDEVAAPAATSTALALVRRRACLRLGPA